MLGSTGRLTVFSYHSKSLWGSACSKGTVMGSPLIFLQAGRAVFLASKGNGHTSLRHWQNPRWAGFSRALVGPAGGSQRGPGGQAAQPALSPSCRAAMGSSRRISQHPTPSWVRSPRRNGVPTDQPPLEAGVLISRVCPFPWCKHRTGAAVKDPLRHCAMRRWERRLQPPPAHPCPEMLVL